MAKRAVVLRKALALITDPSRWIKGDYAQTRDGARAEVGTRKAYKFCARGAVTQAGDTASAHNAITRAARLLSDGFNLSAGVIGFNDTRTHEDVLSLFDVAIAIQEIGE